MQKILFTLLALVWAVAGFAKSGLQGNTFLWKVSKEGRPDSYLLGTMHVGPVGAPLPAAYRGALDKVTQLVVESNEAELHEPRYALDVAKMFLLMSDSRTLNQSVGAGRIEVLNRSLSIGNDKLVFDGSSKLKPWAVWLSVQSLFMPKGYSSEYGIDVQLIKQATGSGKAVVALERLEPLHYFQTIPEDKIKRGFDTINRNPKRFLKQQAQAIEDYYAGNALKLWADLANPDYVLTGTPRQDKAYWQDFLYNKLLIERNQQWLPKLIEILPKESTLVAVGAAHLDGEQGLIRRLRQVGYRVEPVNTP